MEDCAEDHDATFSAAVAGSLEVSPVEAWGRQSMPVCSELDASHVRTSCQHPARIVVELYERVFQSVQCPAARPLMVQVRLT